MKSHTCEFELKDLARFVGWPLLPVVLFAVLMHAGAQLKLLPRPRPTLDTDRTILIHQAEASRAPREVEVLLLGDSSCLMDVSAKQLSTELGCPVLNLGTLSYLDPTAFALLLRQHAAANPDRLRAIALLMHPEALRRTGSELYQLNVLMNFLNARDHFQTGNLAGQLSCASGVDIFKGRVLARALPVPLGGAYGRFYGFSKNLEEYMTANHGSALDPEIVPLAGSAEYLVSAVLEQTGRRFRSAVPPGVKLLVALTPVPEKLAGEGFRRQQPDLLRQWSEWLGADDMLTDLPATLPDDQFARSTHLKPAAVPVYTEILAASLRKRLP